MEFVQNWIQSCMFSALFSTDLRNRFKTWMYVCRNIWGKDKRMKGWMNDWMKEWMRGCQISLNIFQCIMCRDIFQKCSLDKNTIHDLNAVIWMHENKVLAWELPVFIPGIEGWAWNCLFMAWNELRWRYNGLHLFWFKLTCFNDRDDTLINPFNI